MKKMTYSTACEILGFTTPKSLTMNAILAKSKLSTFIKPTLRELVACQILIDATK